jgi:integrase
MAICIRRREFIVTLGSAAAVWPLGAHAQQAAMPVIAGCSLESVDFIGNWLLTGLFACPRLYPWTYPHGAAMATDFLWQRGRQWNFRLKIPLALRQHFVGKGCKPLVRIVEPLGDSYELARIEATRRASVYMAIFARLRAGEKLTPDDIKREIVAAGITPTQRKILGLLHMAGPQAAVSRDSIVRTLDLFEPQAPAPAQPITSVRALAVGDETIGQAAEAWFAEVQSDKSAAVRDATLAGHRLRVRSFIDARGDIPLASITRSMASDFLSSLAAKGLSNRTINNYTTTMQCVFKSARNRGRYTGDIPFADMKRKAGGKSYIPFSDEEVKAIFAALPCEIKPAKHTPQTALPWIVRIAAFSGLRIEEISQLTTTDIETRGTNGGTQIVFNVHNGDSDHHLKTDSAARVVPVHSELVRMGFLDYVAKLPIGPLFPGLSRRKSKGNKIGARAGELFRKLLIKLGIKRQGKVFHSWRHNVSESLERAGISETDVARILGHSIPGLSFGVYSSGPGLARLKVVVEAITYFMAR